MKYLLLVYIIIFYDPFYGQVQNNEPVKIKIDLLNKQGAFYESTSQYDVAKLYLDSAVTLNETKSYKPQLIESYNYLGYIHWHKSNYDSAFYYHNKALLICEENDITDRNLGFTYLMLGNDYYDRSDFIKSSSFYFKGLERSEIIQDKALTIECLNRLSKLFYKLNNFEESLEYANRAIELNSDSNPREMGTSFNSLGNIAIANGQIDSALYFFNQTLTKFKLSGDVIGQTVASINLGDTYLMKSKVEERFLDSSYYHYVHSFILNKRIDNKFGQIYGLWGMADVEKTRLQLDQSLTHYKEALGISQAIGAQSETMNLFLKLHDLYKNYKQMDSSYAYITDYIALRNKIEANKHNKELLTQETKYETQKIINQERLDSEKRRIINEEKSKWKNLVISLILFLFLLICAVALVGYKRLKVTKSKNALINDINSQLNEKNIEITDSINYAKRIQNALLPTECSIANKLPKSFIFYKPKDIVAGDFYWLNESEDNVLFAVADCTGHGVPGAMVSVICCNALNKCITEFRLTEPSKILDKTKELIEEELNKTDEDVQDGMDIGLFSLKFNSKDNTATVTYSGAYIPLWIIRKDNLNEVVETKATKQPIGRYLTNLEFEQHTIQLSKGDRFFISSDGFVDQFGGIKGKKFKANALKKLLCDNSNLDISRFPELLDNELNAWQGNNEQIDDICVFGMEV